MRGRRGKRSARDGEGLGPLFRSRWVIVDLVAANSVEIFVGKKRSKIEQTEVVERSGSCCFSSVAIS